MLNIYNVCSDEKADFITGHFWNTFGLFLKTSLGVHTFIWKGDFIHMQIQLIFVRMVMHQALL